jgi:hypothetical protein
MSRVRSSVLGAFGHSDVPFTRIKDALGVAHDASRLPVFQVVFLLQDAFKHRSGDTEQSTDEPDAAGDVALDDVAMFDMLLALAPIQTCSGIDTVLSVEGKLNYNTDLFDAATAQRMAAQYIELLHSLAASSSSALISQLSSGGPVDESFPLLPMQKIYAVGRKFDMPANICWETELSGFDRHRFETAMTSLIERHGMLRACIFKDGERQRILDSCNVLGADGWKLDQLHEPATLLEFESVMAMLRARTQRFGISLNITTFFDIQAVSRKKLGMVPADKRDTVIVSFVFDLIVADAQSLNTFTSELSALYRGEDLPKLDPLAYRAFVVSKLQMKDAATLQREAAYWEPLVSTVVEEGGLPACPQLPQAQPGAEDSRHTVLRHSSSLPPEMWQRLRAWCGRERVQPNSLLFTVYSEILATWSSTRHFIINMAFIDRGAPSKVFGNCASTMVSPVFPCNTVVSKSRCLKLH